MDPNKQIKYSHYQLADKVQFGGLMDAQQCRELAKKIMSVYDGDGNGILDSFEIGYMQSDCYRAMNKGFNPTPTDIASYSRIIDREGNGKVSKENIEALCLKYFGGQFSREEEQPKQVKQSNDFQSSYTRSSNFQQKKTQSETQVIQSPVEIKPVQEVIQLSSSASQQQQQQQVPPPAMSAEKLRAQKMVQDRLEVARRIFRMIDTDKSGFLTASEVPLLLIETYKQMGMTYEPSQEDVDLWMEMADTDGDGKVYLPDYERLVLNSLKQQGIVLE